MPGKIIKLANGNEVDLESIKVPFSSPSLQWLDTKLMYLVIVE
jgi:hypothetical protein